MKFFALLLVLSSLVACGARSSDEQQVRDLIAQMETAAEARDASDVLEFVADGYADAQGFDKPQLRTFLRGYFLAHPRVELLVNVSDLQFPADGLAQAQITVTRVALDDPDRAHLEVEFRREGDEWRITRADRVER
ncbi:MAG TPA: nuclear transport factor 2 family protein [Steroidobacteraceae bacterium]|nr:nuclear transport factor 2 family protein [Steroidobacteraceae bacterium]